MNRKTQSRKVRLKKNAHDQTLFKELLGKDANYL